MVPESVIGLGMKLITTLLALLAFPAFAVSPPPDGGYPGSNTAEGADALFSLDTAQGVHNTAMGFNSMHDTTTGDYNVATGSVSLESNTTGTYNVATGISALSANTTGEANTALGAFAMVSSNGSFNTAVGDDAMQGNATGNYNTVMGVFALKNNTTGSSNIAIGSSAGVNLVAGSNNIYLGSAGGLPGESRKVRIGTAGMQTAVYVAGVRNTAIPDGSAVVVDDTGRMGVSTAQADRIQALEATVASLQAQIQALQK